MKLRGVTVTILLLIAVLLTASCLPRMPIVTLPPQSPTAAPTPPTPTPSTPQGWKIAEIESKYGVTITVDAAESDSKLEKLIYSERVTESIVNIAYLDELDRQLALIPQPLRDLVASKLTVNPKIRLCYYPEDLDPDVYANGFRQYSGLFVPDDTSIRLDILLSGTDALIHEYGHLIEMTLLSNYFFNQWKTYNHGVGYGTWESMNEYERSLFAGEYASTDQSEDFAETFEVLVRNKCADYPGLEEKLEFLAGFLDTAAGTKNLFPYVTDPSYTPPATVTPEPPPAMKAVLGASEADTETALGAPWITVEGDNGVYNIYGDYMDFTVVYFEDDSAAHIFTSRLKNIVPDGYWLFDDRWDNGRVFAFEIGTAPVDNPDASELLAFHIVNMFRAQKNLRPYTLSPILSEVARTHSEYVMQRGTLTHYGAGGKNPLKRITEAGYDAADCNEQILQGEETVFYDVFYIINTKDLRGDLLQNWTDCAFGWSAGQGGDRILTMLFAKQM